MGFGVFHKHGCPVFSIAHILLIEPVGGDVQDHRVGCPPPLDSNLERGGLCERNRSEWDQIDIGLVGCQGQLVFRITDDFLCQVHLGGSQVYLAVKIGIDCITLTAWQVARRWVEGSDGDAPVCVGG